MVCSPQSRVGLPNKWFHLFDSSYRSTGLGAGSVGPDGTTDPTDPAGATFAVTLAGINATVSRIWDLGGTPDTIMCDAATKQTISSSAVGGAVVATPYKDAGSKDGAVTAVNAVDVLVTDFGTFKVVPNRFSVAETISSILQNNTVL